MNSPQDTFNMEAGKGPQDTFSTAISNSKMIDRDTISGIIDLVGTPVKIYIPTHTANFEGMERNIFLAQPVYENAVIRTKNDMIVVNEQGEQREGDAVGFFKYDSKIDSECEVWVPRDPIEGGTDVYYAISAQISRFENERKFVRMNLQKRRYEPAP